MPIRTSEPQPEGVSALAACMTFIRSASVRRSDACNPNCICLDIISETGKRFFCMTQESRLPSEEIRLWRNARLATLAPSAAGLGVVENGAVAARSGRILYAGPEPDLPSFSAAEIVDCQGRWITPGLIDCHTHLVYAGDRANEFEMRLAGSSYEDVARAGGGIVASVMALRAASEDELVCQSLPRLDALIA